MATLHLLSAGAAQAVSLRIIEAFSRESGHCVAAEFGAVGAMRARIMADAPVDAIVLTQAMVDELVAAGRIVAGSRVDLGRVGTGVAVRAGTAIPPIAHAGALRASVLGASTIVCPDPAIATAGKVVMRLLETLGVADEVRTRLRFLPNGHAAMDWLAHDGGAGDMGITQDTEILPHPGVTYVGPLPAQFQMKTVYSIGLASAAAEPQLAREFIGRYEVSRAEPLLREAGFELPYNG